MMPVGPSYVGACSESRWTSAGSVACAVTETGRECGTSASSAPSRTTIWTPSASARSTTVLENVRQRIAGSGPESRIRSRGARGTRAAWISNSGHSIVRDTPSTRRTIGRAHPVHQPHHRARGLEVDELLRVDDRERLGAERSGDERERGGRRLAGVVPALERADQRRGTEPVRTAIPPQRLHHYSPYRVRRVAHI